MLGNFVWVQFGIILANILPLQITQKQEQLYISWINKTSSESTQLHDDKLFC